MTVRFLKDLPSSSAKGEWCRSNILLFTRRLIGNSIISSIFNDFIFFPLKGQTDSYKEGYKACLQRISVMLPQSNLGTETRQRVNEFIQHSTVSATSSCENCCAQNSRTISQMHQRLVSLRNYSSTMENHSIGTASAHSQPQPAPQPAVDMWRPWWPNRQTETSGKLFIISFVYYLFVVARLSWNVKPAIEITCKDLKCFIT